MHHLRHALGGLLRHPVFSAVAVLTLALGIGANAAVFSIVHATLLRALPYPEPDRIVLPWEHSDDVRERIGFDRLPSSPGDYTDYHDRNTTFAAFASMRADRLNLTGSGDPERIAGVRVGAEFFEVFGLQAIAGRTFRRGDTGRLVVIAEFFDALLARVAILPGVETAGVTSALPLTGPENLALVTIEGQPRPEPGHEVITDYRVVTPGYFRVMGIPLVDGDLLPEYTRADGPRLLVINETMARTCWPGTSALGRRIKLAAYDQEAPWYTAIGVTAALLLTGYLETLLYGVPARDTATFVVVPPLLLAAALLGCIVPARRAMGADPAAALRSE